MPPPPPRPNSTAKRLFQGAKETEPRPPEPNKHDEWTGTFLLTNRANKVGFTDNEVYVSVKAEMMSACLREPTKYIVKSKNFSGPYLIKSTQEIADFFLEVGAVTLLNSTDMVDFQVVKCDQAGRPTEPISADHAKELEAKRAMKREQEQPRTRRFYAMHPDELVGTEIINSDFATEMISNAFRNFMAHESAVELERINVVGGATTTMGFPAPQHIVYAVLPDKSPASESALYPKHLHVPELSEHLLFTIQMPKAQLNQLNLLRCCFSSTCVREEGKCAYQTAMRKQRPRQPPTPNPLQSAEKAKRQKTMVNLREATETDMKARLAGMPCKGLAKGRCVIGFPGSPDQSLPCCLYSHPPAADIADIFCCSAPERDAKLKRESCLFKPEDCPYKNHHGRVPPNHY